MKVEVRRVLVATDFSEAAAAALEWAVDIVESSHASLHVLHVLETIAGAEPVALDIGVRAALERSVEARAWDELRRLLSREEQTRLRVELAIEWGIPVDEILRYVRDHQINLVSVGDRAPDHPPDRLLGRVAEGVVREAPCSVLTIRRAPAASA
jgi:nucleotide-binding universal stress UspA family protein